jgi:syntaxin 8
VEANSISSLLQNTAGIVFERNKRLASGLTADQQDATITLQLSQANEGIRRLEKNLSDAEEAGLADRDLRVWEDTLIALDAKYHQIENVLSPDSTLQKQRHELLSNSNNVKPISVADVVSGAENPELLVMQQQIMSEQDNQLDQLAEVIERQKRIGMQIGDELDLHVQLLEDTDERVDRTQSRLRNAGKRLDDVRVKLREASCSFWTTVLLGIILLLLLILIKLVK